MSSNTPTYGSARPDPTTKPDPSTGDEVVQQVSAAAASARDNVSQSVRDGVTAAGEFAQDAAGQAKAGAQFAGVAAKVIGSETLDSVRQAADQQLHAGTDAVARLARKAGESADSVESTSPHVAGAIRSAAGAVQRAAEEAHDTDVGELLSAVADYGRKRPLTLLAAGVAGGLILGRIFGSSQTRS